MPPLSVAPHFDLAHVRALQPCEQGAVEPYAPIKGASAWLASDFKGASEWTIELSEGHIRELEAAVHDVMVSGQIAAEGNNLEGLLGLRLEEFSLPTLGPLLRGAGDEVNSGRGFVLLKRLPVERWSREQILVAYWLIGLHWGVAMPQNEKQHLIGHVKDVGIDPDNKNPNTRIYMTRAAQPWHVDSADAVALLCLAEAKEGGLTGWASSTTIINIIREEEPELLPVLAGPWFMDRKGEDGDGQVPFFDIPILNYYQGRFFVSYHDTYYQLAAAKVGGVAALTEAHHRALAKFNEVADRPGVAVKVRLAPGELQLLNNHVAVHTRSAYRDWEDDSGARIKTRHLLRLWLKTHAAPPLPPPYLPVFTRFSPGASGVPLAGESDAGGAWTFGDGRVPLEAEVGQAHIPEAAAAGAGAA